MTRMQQFRSEDDERSRGRPLRGIERLMLAIVGSARDDLRSPSEAMRRDARDYVMSNDESDPLSFVAICAHFGWSTARVREGIVQGCAEPDKSRWRCY